MGTLRHSLNNALITWINTKWTYRLKRHASIIPLYYFLKYGTKLIQIKMKRILYYMLVSSIIKHTG